MTTFMTNNLTNWQRTWKTRRQSHAPYHELPQNYFCKREGQNLNTETCRPSLIREKSIEMCKPGVTGTLSCPYVQAPMLLMFFFPQRRCKMLPDRHENAHLKTGWFLQSVFFLLLAEQFRFSEEYCFSTQDSMKCLQASAGEASMCSTVSWIMDLNGWT